MEVRIGDDASSILGCVAESYFLHHTVRGEMQDLVGARDGRPGCGGEKEEGVAVYFEGGIAGVSDGRFEGCGERLKGFLFVKGILLC